LHTLNRSVPSRLRSTGHHPTRARSWRRARTDSALPQLRLLLRVHRLRNDDLFARELGSGFDDRLGHTSCPHPEAEDRSSRQGSPDRALAATPMGLSQASLEAAPHALDLRGATVLTPREPIEDVPRRTR